MNDLATPQTIESADRRHVLMVTVAIFLQVFLSALDTTIISTAMPTVVAALGGLNLYSWVFAAYMLTSTVATPIAGKLSDQISRKKLYLAGIAGFVISSWLCGLAQNLTMLIIFRAVQGVAAGAMIAVSLGLIAVLYPPEKRGRMQGMLASIWAITSMFGPLIGGFVVEHFSWRWSFYINLPIGVTAYFFVKRHLQENTGQIAAIKQNPAAVQIDYSGAITLVIGVVTFLLSITDEIHSAPVWRILLFAISLCFLFIFFQIERRAANPILPLALLRRREIAAANLCTFVSAFGMFGMIMFAPLFVQGALLRSPTAAGMTLIPISLGWALGSLTSGHTVNRFGYRGLALTGAIIMTIGLLLQTQLESTTLLFHIAGVSFIIGLGMGLTTTAITVSVQNTVDPSQVGVATSTTVFSRILGSSIGVSLMGAILSSRLETLLHGPKAPDGRSLAGVFAGMNGSALSQVRSLLRPAVRAQIPPEALKILQHALEDGLRHAFYFAAAAAFVAIFIAMRVSSQRPAPANQKTEKEPSTQMVPG
jgi:EmrB/QacA subfamily drug resistance transporter